ncbi:hypothetical protein [Motilibacter aurantiacus]|uniref:hypothetical protein n=1 Tax=Motilibacter aurantiacus TaxID=2714955 RepID=UPI00140DB475|nr:hypothetical protein [Motilibacter aurantiacus]NHC47011.1 hypothetical protein [Motilibacter aurantiacus]
MDKISSPNAGSGAVEVLMIRRTLTDIQNKAAKLLAELPSDAQASTPAKPGLYL